MQATRKNSSPVRKLVYAAVCLALALVLPFLTGQIPQIGRALCPMHLPVLLCGFLCGWPWALAVGVVAPLLRFALFSMPALWTAIPMAFELGTYGAVAGLLYSRLPRRTGNIYVSLVGAMLAGRVVWGVVKFVLSGLQNTEFPFSAFVAGAFTTAIPGIIVQLVLIPLLVLGLDRAGMTINAPRAVRA